MTEPLKYGTHRTMPEGYIRAADAAALLNVSTCKLGWMARMGFIPSPEDFRPIGSASTYRIYKKEDILAYARKTGCLPSAEEQTKRARLTGTALALLSRLRHYADADGFVSGDASDLVLGNPARKADEKALYALAAAKLIRPGLDNWRRKIFTVAPEPPGAGKEWRAF